MALMTTRRADIEHHLAKYPDKRSAVMPLLYIAQEEYGHITQEAIAEIAEIIDVDVTHIRGLIGFYTMYHDKPKGRHLLYICTDLPCAVRGAEAFSEQIQEHLGIGHGDTTADGMFTLENVMCIGACHRAPVMQVDFRFNYNGANWEDLTFERAKQQIEDLREAQQTE
ncbi:MAG: NAD(P)H-dependent oxidoreductase subunit E [Chloroflexi bacterium]|nr:NAD(P)H-dependent oxidoreductase subunit E [Chloroflexota bacterium]